ncbi:MAG: hypothetical protein K9G49_10140 [Taibaiella sp.]|nr:hypothetical protein [Taibaiella sp.]
MNDNHILLADFLANKPLYSKIDITKIANLSEAFKTQTFDHFCENCEEKRTFKFANHAGTSQRMPGAYEHTYYCKGTCSYCNLYAIEFILNWWRVEENKEETLYLKKIGQNPPYSIRPEKSVNDYLNEEDKKLYKKALMCFSQSYGIGAFAYFRRIIENEIRKIYKDVTGDILAEDEKNAAKMIDNSFTKLPSSLQGLGHNPIKILWEQLSIGLHSLSDDECMDRSKTIDKLLAFVIEKMNSEKTEVATIKGLIKTLTTDRK